MNSSLSLAKRNKYWIINIGFIKGIINSNENVRTGTKTWRKRRRLSVIKNKVQITLKESFKSRYWSSRVETEDFWIFNQKQESNCETEIILENPEQQH